MCMYIYIYIYIFVLCTHMYIYIYNMWFTESGLRGGPARSVSA